MSTRTFLIQGIQVAKGKYTVQDLKKKKTPQRTQHGKLKRQHELVKHTHTHTQKKKRTTSLRVYMLKRHGFREALG